ncbi:DUF4912 domain-containing protein [filamentous cyanobacterium LEGE 11480]|uniref:DUF4912 domain-containing protein n=1 Tax=Romeriopsis navalis LEGE 11480 TaxID=2777977 RepID=A0A928VNP2_9CYAN|nr:DUF4912 domain-containing protein [Romeriopsis navalis]MBE9031665.1 DUF4912 domain-containing protein [Romeriopsis navalis LEGE 11480]
MFSNSLPLTEMTLRQLRRVASLLGISRYSRMRKDQLLASIVEKQGDTDAQTMVETAKKDTDTTVDVALADVDAALPDLPGGYGASQIFLMPRDPQWAYAYWDVANERKEELRQQGGQQLALRLYDVTGIDINNQSPHNLQEYGCDEMTREWYLPIPVSDRDYMLEIGYRTWDGRWLMLARSESMRVPPVYPSDWVEDHFVAVDWEQELRGQTIMTLVPPSQKPAATPGAMPTAHESVFGMAAEAEAMRMSGSLYGSMQHMPSSAQPIESLSSYVFPSGVGMWAMPNASGLTMSGVGMGASMPPVQPRKFWLIADAELIVYGATEPDATVYVDGEPIQLNSDGTFRFQVSFQDGQLRFPIFAVAADGEQNRAIHMDFERQTLERRTNTKEEAQLEWLPN